MTKYPLILNEGFGFDYVCLNLNEDSSPLLASGSVLALLKYCLWGMLAKNTDRAPGSWMLRGSWETPNPYSTTCIPKARGQREEEGALSLARSAVSVVQLQHSWHLVVCGMEVLVLLHTSGSCWHKASNLCVDEISLYLQHLKFLYIFQHLSVLNSSLSYRLLITVLKYSIFKWGFSCKDYVSVILGNRQGAGRRLFFPIFFLCQCEKLTALTKLAIYTSQSSGFPCLSVNQCWHKPCCKLTAFAVSKPLPSCCRTRS